ncbi:Metallothionein expression activator [Nakaseomyces bracarensis]|uniref:Metallothionein expression activator n=1 Tax=Nakaseomyces bracarensis TaxID=273131 RepID=A0ABR4NRV5_9SACH
MESLQEQWDTIACDPNKDVAPGYGEQNQNNELLENFFDFNYNDVDNLLTEELKDLDIPMAPSPRDFNNNGNTEEYFNWTENSNSRSKKPSVSHKRGLSGTAIFGFRNHNKTLSIASISKNMPQVTESIENYGRQEPRENVVLSQVLLKQQEELRMALERQKEVNRKLEEQLRENRIQQEHIQKVLLNQEVATSQLVSHSNDSSPSKQRSPLKPSDDAIIVTKNSDSGGYVFPPPHSNSKNMVSPPVSMSPYDDIGSLSSINFNYLNPNDILHKDYTSQKTPQSFHEKENNTLLSAKELLKPNSKFNPYENSTSPRALYSSPNSMISPHRKKDSVLSTVSTIPQPQDEYQSTTSHSRGINEVEPGTKNGNHMLRPPVDIMPTIAGSSHNTPATVGKSGLLPQKHIFQHTPVKANPQKYQEPSNRLDDSYSHTPKQTIRNDKADLQSAYNPLQEFDDIIAIKTPKPKSNAGEDIGSGERLQFSNLDYSPLKVRSRPTTLPPGYIDQYVKVLPDKNFECLYPNCGKLFKRRYNIRSHIQTHLEDKPFKCDYDGCNKAFVRNHDLVRHKKIHEKQFTCLCGKKFNNEDIMNRHRNRNNCTGPSKVQETMMVNKSPKKFSSPTKLPSNIINSPIKQSYLKEGVNTNIVPFKMDDELRNSLRENGLLKPVEKPAQSLVTPSPISGFSDMETPFHEFEEIDNLN